MNILYLCTGNSCRSQMAEAWTRHLRPEINSWSAGVARHGMNENMLTVMEEAGVDMTGYTSKTVDELPAVELDYVVTLCGHAAENCPYFPSKAKRVHRGFQDPPKLTENMTNPEEILAVYRQVRDEIKILIQGLPDSLKE